jgi:hypothetical protein
MLLAEFESIDVLWIVLSAFLVVIVVPLAILLVRLAGTATRLGRLLEGREESVPPLVTKTGGTVDRVNLQLDKVDLVTDSAVSAADSLDTTARAVSMVVVTPVQKLSAFAKGISHGSSALFAGEGFSTAVEAGKDAARRREQEIAEELARKDDRLALRRPAASAEPAAGEEPAPTPSPEPAVVAEPVPTPAAAGEPASSPGAARSDDSALP